MKSLIHSILLPLLAGCTFLTGCTSAAEPMEVSSPTEATAGNVTNNTAPNSIVHYNIIITPDLSNRLANPKPVTDGQIVNVILKNIYPTILKHGRMVNQQDLFSTSITSNRLLTQHKIKTEDLQIDFARFENDQMRRINYITGKARDASLDKDRQKFLQEFTRVSTAAAKSTSGADLWTYFNTGITSGMVRDKGPETKHNKKVYKSQYRNIMVLLTDGYIEASMYGKNACSSGNQCYYLSSAKIKEFRLAFKKSGNKSLKDFFETSGYGLAPVQNPNLGKLEVLVLQMEDRSLNKAGNATIYPTDAEIQQLFWSDWLKKSGVKRFELKPALASEAETEKAILGFMGI